MGANLPAPVQLAQLAQGEPFRGRRTGIGEGRGGLGELNRGGRGGRTSHAGTSAVG